MRTQITIVSTSSSLKCHVRTNCHVVKTFEDYDRFLPPKGIKAGHIFDQFMPPEDARNKLNQIKGHLVWFPLEFLRDAEMAERGMQVNSWTETLYT